MKKILLLLLLTFGFANAQIINIPDATFKAELLAASPTVEKAMNFDDQWIKIDANNDGEIQESEAQQVKLLAISELLVFNVTGIEGFSNLESLRITTSLITTLNIGGLTNLKSLTCLNMQILSTLNVNGATNLNNLMCISLPNLVTLNINNLTNLTKLNCLGTSIVSLNVSGLPNLAEILYSGNQLTTTMNLSQLPSLTKLDCAFNNLSVLTANELTALTDLNCSGNQLTNLNGFPNLIKLNCENNKLTSLNVSSLTDLTELYCGGNELTSLNVNGLENLTTLSCAYNKFVTFSLNGLPNLVNLDCGNNNELTSVTLQNLPNLQELKVIGNVNGSSVPLGQLTTLNLSGLPNLQKLDCKNGVLTSLSLEGLSSLTELNCSRNQITNLNVSNLPNLQKLVCDTNPISALNVSNLTNLVELTCAGGYVVDGQLTAHLTTLDVSGLTNLKKLYCAFSLLTTLDLTGLSSLEELYCDGISNDLGQLASLNVNGLTNLKKLSCNNQQLTSLNVSNLTNLTDLYCSSNHITSLDLTGLINLKVLDYTYNQLANLNLVDLPSLTTLNCSQNQLVTLNVLNLASLTDLNCSFNQLTTLNLSGLNSLVNLDYSHNQLTLSNISGLSTNLKSLVCDSNNLTSLDVSGLINLEGLSCNANQLTGLDVSTLVNLKTLTCANNQITSLEVFNSPNLEALDCSYNLIENLNVFWLNNLKQLYCINNQLTNLDLSNQSNLNRLDYSNNLIPNLNVNNLTNLQILGLSGTQTTVLDVSNLNQLNFLYCNNNLLTTLDVNNAPFLHVLHCNNNQLETLFIKNGRNEQDLSYSGNPNLAYICADASQIESIQTQLNNSGMNATVCNTYCSFTPGGNNNTITGVTIFDFNNNGCDVADEVNPFIRLDINDGTEIGSTVTNINGTYNFYTDAGTFEITPNIENPTWFEFSPPSSTFTFTTDNNIATQNFCIQAVGMHQDIEVVLAPLEPARPGFDATYKVVYKNKGNQMVSGAVNFIFDDARTDFISAEPIADAVEINSLTWNYVNLMPFENRSIVIRLNVNGPMETPAVNNGDVLNFTTSITPVAGDELPLDNQFAYNQTVVGSFDPNDIVCIEGDNLSSSEIGNYLHYIVNFENTGTAPAENVVVKVEIDTTKYDLSSLQLLNGSHPVEAMVNNNIAEFIFKAINLETNGHGNILLKVRSKSSVNEGETVTKKANIYFDYNFPILTNDANTTFQDLSIDEHLFDNSIAVYPNPSRDVVNIEASSVITSIQVYDIQGRLLMTHLPNDSKTTIDIADKANGVYFFKINSDRGIKVEKIIKK
ncbi:Leucine-rich repeat (LRR) protein [Flavobacterium arsenatis]|uniref:Leucine-rich repeat (LRR) protein n=1 Tax=Flavobacterium arsenatis TaxID=1484332 RepID=A0ABU1TR48_9FLAO|nr:leucine-rich repeat domain-containing protein [Flavobacterium arsenatis]MDR6967928.1 Leucine-rich repeat (LRR) protein [Flavobacterium arsenatis]